MRLRRKSKEYYTESTRRNWGRKRSRNKLVGGREWCSISRMWEVRVRMLIGRSGITKVCCPLGAVAFLLSQILIMGAEMLVSFFKAVTPLLAPHGTVIVTLFEGEPYTLWNIRDLARHSGLEVQRSFRFQAEAYPGYSHARTLGNIEGGGGWKGEERPSRSYVFQHKGAGELVQKQQAKNNKRKKVDESDDEDSDED